MALSSKPASEMSRGMSMPAAFAASMIPAAISSLLAKIAVGLAANSCAACSRPDWREKSPWTIRVGWVMPRRRSSAW